MANEGNNQLGRPKRNPFLRLIFGILWFIPISLIINIIIGGIVGGITGASTQSYEAGYSAGQAASIEFFQKYGSVVFVCQILLTATLSLFGILPGTGKFKRKQHR